MLTDKLAEQYSIDELKGMLRKPLSIRTNALLKLVFPTYNINRSNIPITATNLLLLLNDEDVKRQIDSFILNVKFNESINRSIVCVNKAIINAIKYKTLKSLENSGTDVLKPKQDRNLHYSSEVLRYLNSNFKNYYVRLIDDINSSYYEYLHIPSYRTHYNLTTSDGVCFDFNIHNQNNVTTHRTILGALRFKIDELNSKERNQQNVREKAMESGVCLPNDSIEKIIRDNEEEIIRLYLTCNPNKTACCGENIKHVKHVCGCGNKWMVTHKGANLYTFNGRIHAKVSDIHFLNIGKNCVIIKNTNQK